VVVVPLLLLLLLLLLTTNCQGVQARQSQYSPNAVQQLKTFRNHESYAGERKALVRVLPALGLRTGTWDPSPE
jgi:hypothetical protein